MRHIQHSLLAVVISLSGCGAPVTQIVSSPQPVSAITEDVDLVPPVPTFLTFADCELAYGQGSCGTGAQIYTTANLAVPAGAATWYVPFAYGAMTGVLVNRYYGPPTVYVSSIPYRVFVSPVVVQRYRVVDTNVIEVFRRAPLLVRNETIMSGPVRFAPTRGVITSRPYAHPPDGHPSPTPADSQSRTRMPPVQTRTTVVPADSRDLSATPNTKSQAPQGQSTPRPAPAASLPQRPAGIQNPAVQAPTTQSPPPTTAPSPRPPRPVQQASNAAAPVQAAQHPATPAPAKAPEPKPIPAATSAKPCNKSLPQSETNCAK